MPLSFLNRSHRPALDTVPKTIQYSQGNPLVAQLVNIKIYDGLKEKDFANLGRCEIREIKGEHMLNNRNTGKTIKQ